MSKHLCLNHLRHFTMVSSLTSKKSWTILQPQLAPQPQHTFVCIYAFVSLLNDYCLKFFGFVVFTKNILKLEFIVPDL